MSRDIQDLFDEFYSEDWDEYCDDLKLKISKPKKCTCGADKCNSPKHSEWCEKFEE